MALLEEKLHRALFGVMTFGAGQGDAAVCTLAADLLSQHLAAGDLTVPRRFEAMRALLVLGIAVAAADPARVGLVAQLLAAGLDQMPDRPSDDPLKLSLRNNHLLMQAAVLLSFPEVASGRAGATELTARFLAEMTDDGLFPSELCRGASALWYANMAVMLLTTIAALSDHDVVSPNVLKRAIAGFGHALSLPPEVLRLARQNLYPQPGHGHNPTAPDLGFLKGYHRSRHYLAWVPLAQSLLPDTPLPVSVSADDQFPLANDFIGGFATTMVARIAHKTAAQTSIPG
ncbi:MAG: alginate lyase family protein [Pseudotabrizicola sp.]|uniref:alginate lyase family protein n=1 Tax=Pseudotabrizicola sp. TaxID=2939647 RepID=UPI00273034E9|nr:alginate lyase family protein [Pseudotabrizicola sp.]MDP2081315.1 alginate lyase family protein [Pseudotabrizicola sp.]MDZ7576066.1 alginate lyase family protein [Pseudotabrizicola sp.]